MILIQCYYLVSTYTRASNFRPKSYFKISIQLILELTFTQVYTLSHPSGRKYEYCYFIIRSNGQIRSFGLVIWLRIIGRRFLFIQSSGFSLMDPILCNPSFWNGSQLPVLLLYKLFHSVIDQIISR